MAPEEKLTKQERRKKPQKAPNSHGGTALTELKGRKQNGIAASGALQVREREKGGEWEKRRGARRTK